MKKPNYIEIRLPGRKSTFSSPRVKYFKHLEGKVLSVNFAPEKERKIFEYFVRGSSYHFGWGWCGGKDESYLALKLELKVPKED